VNRLDDAPVQPSATQAQPEPFDDDPILGEMKNYSETLVTLTFASWNHVAELLRRIHGLRQVACGWRTSVGARVI
jgi:hypothetical protein